MVGTRTRVLTLFALAVIVTAAVLPVTAGPARAADAVAEFDWEMPARTGLDANDDGVIDARVTRAQIDPASWQVNFDACASTPSDSATIVEYRWLIERYPIGDGGPQCGGFTYYFPEEGVYEVTLAVRDSAGNEAHVIRDIAVQDWLIVALGDSFGSGQGNPDVPIPGDLFRATETALVRLDARLAELGTIETDYREIERKVQDVRLRLADLIGAIAHEADVCNLFSSNYNFDECFGPAATAVRDATTDLLTALTDLGLEALIATLGLIEESLQDIKATWDTAVDLARTAVTDAQEAFDAAQAEAAPVWQDRRCNRSSISGQAQAALELEEADPHTSVTLVHLACSGAEILEGLIGPYAGVEPPSPDATDLPPQVDKARALIRGREVDAVLVSIGGNDAGFGEIVKACIIQDGCHQWDAQLQAGIEDQLRQLCELTSFFDADCFERYSRLIERYGGVLPDSAAEIFDDGAAALPGAYDDLAAALAAAFPAVAADPGRVYITEYPNALEDDDGTICTSEEDGPFNMLPGITLNEGLWLRDTVTRQLNDLVADAAEDHRWTLVDGIFDGFAGHGYCADHGWWRRLQDSFRMQGTMEGVVHPTAPGHVVYGEEYLAELRTALYTPDSGGVPDLGAPRPPNLAFSTGHDSAPPSVIGVPDRAPNAAGWYSDDVTIDWQATDPAPSSGMPTDPPNTVASIEGSGVVYTSEASCDPADRCATGSLTLSIDKTAPSVIGVPDRAPNAAGWYSDDVTIDWQATDPAPSSGTPTDPQDTVASTEGSGVVYTSEASCDPADGCATGSLTLAIDKTMPEVACQSPGPTFQLGTAGATVSAAVSDALSGPVAAAVSLAADTTSVGAKTVSLTGRDVAGNERTASCSYVVAYVFGGFLSPVDEGGVLNVAKAGRAIPLKWSLTDAFGAPVMGLTTATVTVRGFVCSAATSADLVEETVAGGSGLQNLGDGYYQLNWKTPSSYAGSCKTMRLDLGEGLVHTALFNFTK